MRDNAGPFPAFFSWVKFGLAWPGGYPVGDFRASERMVAATPMSKGFPDFLGRRIGISVIIP